MKDTPTPMTDELYRDHMSDPYQDTGDLAAIMHIQCERFERELTAVTEQRDGLRSAVDYASDKLAAVTEQRDRLAEAQNILKQCLSAMPVGYIPTHTAENLPEMIGDLAKALAEETAEREKFERELNAVTEQRDTALKKLKNQADRICYLEGATNHATGTPLSKAIEQRDRLAEAMQKLRNNESMSLGGAAYEIVEQTLQSLTTNEQ